MSASSTDYKVQNNLIDDLDLKEKDYFVVSCHREENVDIKENFNSLVESLNKVAETYKKPIIFFIS